MKGSRIAIQLGVPFETIQELKKEEDPLAAILYYCLKGNAEKTLTWELIVEALKSSHVNEGGLAADIEKKYCKKEEAIGQDVTQESCSAPHQEKKPIRGT